MGILIKPNSIVFGVEEYNRAALSREELGLFKAEFDTLFNVTDSIEKRMLQERFDTIQACTEAIKFALDSKPFKGIAPADTEIGWSRIRPEHFGMTNWKVSLTAGWQDWLGSWTSPYTVPDDVGFIILGFKSYSATPKLAAVHVKVGRQEFVPIDVRFIKAKDNPNGVAIAPIPTLILVPKVEVAIRFQSDETADDEIEPVGIAVGLGRYLKKESYT